MCVRSGVNGERRCEIRRTMIQNVSMIGTPRTSERDGDLGGPEDGQHGQRVADELDAAGPGEDRGRVEVPAQEPEQRPGEGEAQDGDQRLADGPTWVVRLMMPEGHRGDERDPRRQPVEAVDPVDAVDHPDDPEDREARGERAVRRGGCSRPNGLAMKPIVMPSATAPTASAS